MKQGSTNGWVLNQYQWSLCMMVVIYKASGTADEVESNKYQIPKRKGSKDLSKNSRIFAKL